MFANTNARLAGVLALVTLAVGCTDSAPTTAPAVARPTAALAVAVKRPKTPYIADLQLSSIYVSISGGFTPYTVTVNNDTPKDFSMIYLKGELQSQNNQAPWPASAFIAYCPFANGIVPRGSC